MYLFDLRFFKSPSAIDVVQRFLVSGQRRLVNRLGEARMCVNRALQVLGARGELERQHGCGNQLAGHRADDVHAEDLIIVRRERPREGDGTDNGYGQDHLRGGR